VGRASIIIPVRNDAACLTKLLASIEPRDLETHQVLVVDDDSTDETAAAAERFPAEVIRLERNVGPSAARNHGARLASASVLVFIDSDVVLGAGALSRLTSWLDDPQVAGVSTIASDTPENPGFISRYCAVTDRYVCETWDAKPPGDTTHDGVDHCSWLSTRLGAIRADLFAELGGFDTSYERPCIEDAEFSARLARDHSLILDRGVTHTHHWPATLSVLMRRVFINSRLLMTMMREADPADGDVMSVSERAGRILSGLAVALLLTAPFSVIGAVASAVCFAASAWYYRGLFGAYGRAGGVGFLLGAIVLHYITTCAGLAGAALGLVAPVARPRLKKDHP
jgi:glycosyltransferase involved in cell wall biosynthesis